MMRFLTLTGTCLLLAACGFAPMYGSGAGSQSGMSATTGLDTVEIDTIPDAEGVALRNQLIDRFYASGYPSSPQYQLSVAKVREAITDFDLTVESETTSRQVKLFTSFGLKNIQTGEVVLTRDISAFTSYNVVGSQFTTRVSEADSREAAINDLARQIETQVALYFKR